VHMHDWPAQWGHLPNRHGWIRGHRQNRCVVDSGVYDTQQMICDDDVQWQEASLFALQAFYEQINPIPFWCALLEPHTHYFSGTNIGTNSSIVVVVVYSILGVFGIDVARNCSVVASTLSTSIESDVVTLFCEYEEDSTISFERYSMQIETLVSKHILPYATLVFYHKDQSINIKTTLLQYKM